MVEIGKAVIARMNSHGHHFEILVDCDASLAVKAGKDVDSHALLAAMKVFTDSHKGLEASPKAIQESFGTTDVMAVAKIIITKGELQLTQEYRKRLQEQKHRQLLNMLHTNGVDPKTHAPHPIDRWEKALEEAKFHVDPFKPVEAQLQDAVKALKALLPIKFEIKELDVKIGPKYAGKVYPTLKKYGSILKESWQDNGYLHAYVEIPGGLEADFYEAINSVCHGEVEVTVIKTR